jgi:nicotinamide riboside kinase
LSKARYNKVWFTGAHGTGKTTQVNYFLEQVNTTAMHPKWQSLDVERRDLHAKGIINLNKKAGMWDEVVIAGNVMLGILRTSAPFISDRSWVCKCAYSQALPFEEKLLDALHLINTKAFPGFNSNELYIYVPPVIPLEDDGVRSVDPEYQKEIDYYVQFYLDYFKIPFYTLESYSVQDRHLEIIKEVFGEV